MYVKIVQYFAILLVCPFLFGVINRTKAFFAGRKGRPLLQLYYDIIKLLYKGAVYSRTTTWIFIAGPVISLCALCSASLLIPFAGYPSLISFDGDLVLFIYMLGLARFFTVLAALDTGSSFEGMGASREVQFAVFAEPAIFLSLATLVRITGQVSLSEIFAEPVITRSAEYGPSILLVLGAVFIVFLAENCRIPVDDPNTHLELTMVHEVMILDHGGIDLAYVFYGSAVKFWLLGTFLVGVFLGKYSFGWVINSVVFVFGMLLLAVVVGVAESVLARLRLIKVPHLLIIALTLSVVALILTMR